MTDKVYIKIYMKLFTIFVTSFFVLSAWALSPIDGVILGEVKDLKQYDPLGQIYTIPKNIVDQENYRLKIYHSFLLNGQNLSNKCESIPEFRYNSSWNEAQAKRAVASTLQYIGLDLTVKAIAEYSKILELTEDQYDLLVDNLVNKYCSKNLTVYSLKLIKNNLIDSFYEKNSFKLPSVANSPYFSEKFKEVTESKLAKKREFDLTLKNFVAFCSYGGDSDDFRLLSSYLNNSIIMSYIHHHLNNKKLSYVEGQSELIIEEDLNSVQVVCEDLICRKSPSTIFQKKFPRIIGSDSIANDLELLYCKYFKNTNINSKSLPTTLKKINNDLSLEQPIIEIQNFLSLLTTIPEPLSGVSDFSEFLSVIESTVFDTYDTWAKNQNKSFIIDYLYEESLQLTLVPQKDIIKISQKEFEINFNLTLGELDNALSDVDKLTMQFNLKIPKGMLRYFRNTWINYNNSEDSRMQDQFIKEMASYIAPQILMKENRLLVNIWNPQINEIIAYELLQQLEQYQGSYFNDLRHENVSIPIKFRYGLFALQYIRSKFKSNYKIEGLKLVKRNHEENIKK
jgi:hypothetical protein